MRTATRLPLLLGAAIACAGCTSGDAATVPGEGWTATVVGQSAGTYTGPIAIATVHEGRVTRVQLYSDESATPYVTISIDPSAGLIPPGATGPTTAEIVLADSPDLFDAMQRGTASSLNSGRDDDPRYPPLPNLAVANISDAEVTGSISAELFRAQPAPGDPSERASADVSFTARACHTRTPSFTACTSPKTAWPTETDQ